MKEGKILPSVTQIMKSMSESNYANIPPFVLERAAKRGTAIHQAIELLEEQGIEPTEYRDYILQYKKARKLENFDVMFNEVMLSTHEFAGTIDMLATHKHDLILIDLKVTSKINTDLLEVQLAGYQELLKYHAVEVKRAYVLQLKSNTYKFEQIRPNVAMWDHLKVEYFKNRQINESVEATK